MAMLKPAWMQANVGDTAVEYTGQDDRRVLRALFSREGVNDVIGGHLKVSQRAAGANMSVDVAAGECAIYGDDVSDQGAYQCTSSAVENRAVYSTGGAIAAPASGSRTHRVVARIKDKKHNGAWTVYDWAIEVLQDTGSGTPAVPASAIGLGRFTIAAAQPSITNANCLDDRSPWSVGTPDLTGAWSLNPGNWAQSDAGRPLTYRINPEGWVSLAGFVNRIGNTFLCLANVQYDENPSNRLPAVIRPNTNRDFLGLTSLGPVHWLATPSGAMWMRFVNNTNLPQNGCWMTFDGVGYRVSN